MCRLYTHICADSQTCSPCRELREKDIARLQANLDDLAAKEKRGLTKDQKEEREHAQKVLDFLQTGTDVRYSCLFLSPMPTQRSNNRY